MIQTMLELCDGWYSIPCLPDEVITAQVQKKRLRVGQKIITCGAQILGSQEPCSPLEVVAVVNFLFLFHCLFVCSLASACVQDADDS